MRRRCIRNDSMNYWKARTRDCWSAWFFQREFRNPYIALADIYNLRTRFILMTTRNHWSLRHARLRILGNKVVDIVEYVWPNDPLLLLRQEFIKGDYVLLHCVSFSKKIIHARNYWAVRLTICKSFLNIYIYSIIFVHVYLLMLDARFRFFDEICT